MLDLGRSTQKVSHKFKGGTLMFYLISLLPFLQEGDGCPSNSIICNIYDLIAQTGQELISLGSLVLVIVVAIGVLWFIGKRGWALFIQAREGALTTGVALLQFFNYLIIGAILVAVFAIPAGILAARGAFGVGIQNLVERIVSG